MDALFGVYQIVGEEPNQKVRWVGVYYNAEAGEPDPEERQTVLPNRGSGMDVKVSWEQVQEELTQMGRTNLLEKISTALENSRQSNGYHPRYSEPQKILAKLRKMLKVEEPL